MMLWYLTRSTAVVAFVLMTASFALGIAATKRHLAARWWPRFATQQLHRNFAMIAILALIVHIVTTLADTYVHVGWAALVIPGLSGYRTLWVALGTLAFDVFLLVIVSSLLRDKLPVRVWRTMHWAVYAAWPLSFLHFLKTGTDAAHGRWGLWLAFLCLAVVTAATVARFATRRQAFGPLRSIGEVAR